MDERYAVVDVETTGLSIYRDRVVEIGCVLVDGGAIADQWSTLVDPGIPIPGRASAIHGITDADVDGAPDFDDALAMLRRKVGRRTIAAHNATFDLAFLAPLRPERAMHDASGARRGARGSEPQESNAARILRNRRRASKVHPGA
ncbi:MAG: 3'-5' exonuclease [Burkholderiales bacterium]